MPDGRASEDEAAGALVGAAPEPGETGVTATAPNWLWVTHLTFVATWAGVARVRFIVDAFSRMIGEWRVAPHMLTEMGTSAPKRLFAIKGVVEV